MSTSTISVERRRTLWLARAADYVELTKPKISVLVLVTVVVAAFVARWGHPNWVVLLHAVIGTALVAASASALNQFIEQRRDALMDRTSARPLPAGRLTSSQVVVFAGLSISVGVAYLAMLVNPLTAVLGLTTWFLYVFIYTPLKIRTSLNTAVGAVAGALPVLMGWSATGAAFDVRSLALFLIVFLWQFPHFMAIAWIYRKQYARGGMKMLPVVDPSGRRAGVQAVLAALALLPVSIVPGLLAPGTSLYLLAAFTLGVGQLLCATMFLSRMDERAARRLLRASLVYLPALLAALMLVPFV